MIDPAELKKTQSDEEGKYAALQQPWRRRRRRSSSSPRPRIAPDGARSMLKSKQSSTSARRSSSMSSNSTSNANANANANSSSSSSSYAGLDPEAPDMDDAGIDLEIGIGPPLYRAAARKQAQMQMQMQKQKQKPKPPGLASLASRAIEDLQKPRKVSTWVLLAGGLGFALCALYVAGLVLGALAAKGAPRSLPGRDRHSQFSELRNLVMVAGHSVYTSRSCENPGKESSWFLEAYQKHPGQASTFIDHIRGGIEAASIDDHALLLFSGGETRKDAGPRSEAQSYWSVAESSEWFGAKQEVRWRALTEEHARDSFENLLFSICRFRELTGNYPGNITVVSYDFKESRFVNLHRLALRFPSSRFFYKGTPSSPSSAEAASKGEAHVQLLFREDPYGCIGPLHSKRVSRDPFMRTIPYPHGCPELGEIFSYCGSGIFPGILPWD